LEWKTAIAVVGRGQSPITGRKAGLFLEEARAGHLFRSMTNHFHGRDGRRTGKEERGTRGEKCGRGAGDLKRGEVELGERTGECGMVGTMSKRNNQEIVKG